MNTFLIATARLSKQQPHQIAEIKVKKSSFQEKVAAINWLKNNRTDGSDIIPAECLKYAGKLLDEKIHQLIVKISNFESIPF